MIFGKKPRVIPVKVESDSGMVDFLGHKQMTREEAVLVLKRYHELQCEEYCHGKTEATSYWLRLPLFPVRIPNAVCCPICASTDLDNRFSTYYRFPIPGLYKNSNAIIASLGDFMSLHYITYSKENYDFEGLETMDCSCKTCKYTWKMRIERDTSKLDCLTKSFCSFCGCNYNRDTHESCPGCGGRS